MISYKNLVIAVDNNKVKDCIVTVLTIIISPTKCLDHNGQTNITLKIRVASTISSYTTIYMLVQI